MVITFETEHLILRPFRVGDLNDIHEQVYSDPEVCIYYCGATRSKARTKRWLQYRIAEAEYSDFYAWAVEVKQTCRVIGLVRLGPYVNDFPPPSGEPYPPFNSIEVELSFAFGRAHWGKGYAAEACRQIIDHAFRDLRLPRLLGGIRHQNLRSVRFHETLGYRVRKNLNDDDLETILDNPWPRELPSAD